MRIALYLIILGCAGCASTAEYPADWPQRAPVTKGDVCPDISGTYKNAGQSAAEEHQRLNLSDVLLIPGIDVRILTLEHDGADIVVSRDLDGERGGLHLATLSSDARDFFCDEGRIWIAASNWSDPGGDGALVLARESTTVGLSKTDDDSLLAEIKDKTSGVVMVAVPLPIPVAMSGKNFVLWRSVQEMNEAR
jgi:hypothetical protein